MKCLLYIKFVYCCVGRDLIGVQNLMKKHQAVMGEMAQHEARVEAVRAAGAALRAAGHFAADDIAARLQQLHTQWTQLQEKALQVNYSITILILFIDVKKKQQSASNS